MIQLTEKQKMKFRSQTQKALIDLFIYSILICIVFLILYPLFSNISDMFKSREDLLDKSVAFIPKEFTLERITQTIDGMHFWTTIRDTALLSLMNAVLQTLVCTMIGYGFARFKFPLKKLLFALVIFTMLVPIQLLMPSYYVRFQQFDILGIFRLLTGSPVRLLNTPVPFIILSGLGLGFKNGLYIYFIRQFFINIPKELDESGRIDGAGFLRIFFQLMVPNAKPILITVFLFGFSWQWTEQYLTTLFLPGHMFLANSFNTLIVSSYMDGVVTAANVSTGVVLSVLPILIVYIFLQKYFIQGVERTGLVG